ncbi:MAG TPA: hypothetical protein VE089_04855, partial [Nitrososphaeraceae archaeon]|nr:hypothetical protein [Nitrososphaeraceae archaeon]
HHTFLDMPNPAWFQIMSQTASFGIIFPSGLTIMTVMMYIFRSRIKWMVKVTEELEKIILELRLNNKFGPRRIRFRLKRKFGVRFIIMIVSNVMISA